jgi:hypothetical protein
MKIVDYIKIALEAKQEKRFSLRKVSGSIRELTKALEDVKASPTKDDRPLWEAFFALQREMYAPQHREEVKIHPSALANQCIRAAYYELSEVPASNKANISAGTQRIFDVGTWWHTYIQDLLAVAGVLIGREVSVKSKKYRISGRADGIVLEDGIKYLLEIKTMNSWSFGGLTAPNENHITQASLYADILGLDRILFIYINKDTSALKEFKIHKENSQLIRAYEKIDVILHYVNNERCPKRDCEKKSDGKGCPYQKHCFNDTTP